jgi:hypothetical protein
VNEIQEADLQEGQRSKPLNLFEKSSKSEESLSSEGKIWTIRSTSKQRGESIEEERSQPFGLSVNESWSSDQGKVH